MTASANVELVRSIFEAWGRGDFSAADWAHTDIEFVLADGPITGTWTGSAGLAEASREEMGPMEHARIVPQDYRELDQERVLVLVVYAGRGKTSGLDLADLRSEGAWIVHVSNGKVAKFVRYWDRARAFADLGLAPESGSSAA